MRYIWHDIRFAVRVLIKNRWFTIAAVIALALGIGANSAVFTFVNAVLLRDLPFDHAEQIVALSTREVRGREFGVSLQDFDDWQRASRTINPMALVFGANLTISGDDQAPEQYQGVYMSASGFSIIGEKALIGRTLTSDDDRVGAPPVVVLGSTVWKTRYGSSPSVLGRSIRVNALDARVVGVMADGMKFPFNSELWVPAAQLPPALREQGRPVRQYFVFGRLANGATVDQAKAELSNVSRELARQYPASNKDMTAVVMPFLERVIGPQIKLIFWALMGAVAFVLLIACSNVANLLLAQAAGRAREIGVRVSLGATRWRIIRQLLVESVLLSIVSGIIGLGLATFGIRWFDAATTGVGKPYWMVFTMDARVFSFFAIVCVATGILFGLVPALHISKTNLNDVLKEGGRSGAGGIRTRRWAAALIVAQLTLTLVLLAGAGFMMRSFLVLYRTDFGFDPSRLLTMQLTMPARKYPSVGDRAAFLKRVDDRLSSVAAIEAATTASTFPVFGGAPRQLAIEGRTLTGDHPPNVLTISAGPHYFDTLGVRVLRGRPLIESDGTLQQSVVINRTIADIYFKNEDPIGKRIRLTEEFPTAPQTDWFTIVGVTPPVRQAAMQQVEPDLVVYVPHLESPTLGRGVFLIVRTRSDPAKATAALRTEMRGLDPDMPLYNIRTMDEQLAQARWLFSTFGMMFAVFAGIALLLSAVGLYAVTAYSVTQRTQEIGVRMALGAEPRSVRWLILRRALVQLSTGLVLGLAGAVGVGKLLASLLVQTGPADPTTLIAIVSLLVTVAIAAAVWPARRATRLDPVVALRYE